VVVTRGLERPARALCAIVAAAVFALIPGGVAAQQDAGAVAIRTAPRPTDDCAAIGTPLFILRGDPWLARPVWLEEAASGVQVEASWPFGWTVRYDPLLELFDHAGTRIASEGDRVDVEAGLAEDEVVDLFVCRVRSVNGREIPLAPAPTVPAGWSPPPAPPSGIELSVCGNDGDEADGRDLIPWFTVTFVPRGDAGVPAGSFRVDDRSCQLIPFPLHPGDYRILVMAPGWQPETWDETVVLGSSMGTVFVGLRPIGAQRPARPTPAPFTPPPGMD